MKHVLALGNCDYNLNVPLTQQVYGTVFIRNWASMAVTDTMMFSFADYKKRLQDSSSYYTKYGWQGFTKALDKSRILESVKENNQIITATIIASPVILEEGIKKPLVANISRSDTLTTIIDLIAPEAINNDPLEGENAYFWVVEVPIVLTFQAGNKKRSDKLVIKLVIFRSSDPNNPDGIGINQWLAVKA